jgi:hypothetical protein
MVVKHGLSLKQDIRKQGAEEDIWTYEAGRIGRLNETA